MLKDSPTLSAARHDLALLRTEMDCIAAGFVRLELMLDAQRRREADLLAKLDALAIRAGKL